MRRVACRRSFVKEGAAMFDNSDAIIVGATLRCIGGR